MEPTVPPQKPVSQLRQIGCLTSILALVGSVALGKIAARMGDGSGNLTGTQSAMFLATDALRLLFFVGIIVFIIGVVRSRKQ